MVSFLRLGTHFIISLSLSQHPLQYWAIESIQWALELRPSFVLLDLRSLVCCLRVGLHAFHAVLVVNGELHRPQPSMGSFPDAPPLEACPLHFWNEIMRLDLGPQFSISSAPSWSQFRLGPVVWCSLATQAETLRNTGRQSAEVYQWECGSKGWFQGSPEGHLHRRKQVK